MYEQFEELCKQNGVTAYQVCKETGIDRSTISSWKSGAYSPKADKLQRIAEYFNVPVEYLITGKYPEKESASGEKYYFSDETAQLAQAVFEDPSLRILFDAARNARQEDILMMADLLRKLKSTNREG